MLELRLSERWYTGKTQVCEFMQFLKQEVNGHDRYLVAIRKVNALERTVTLCKCIDGLVCQVVDSHETNTTKLG